MAAVIRKLIALAPYFPEVWPILVVIFGEIQKLGEILKKANPTAPPTAGGLSLTAADPEEEAALNELAQELGSEANGTHAIVNLDLIRQIIALARQYPEVLLAVNAVLDWLVSAMGKKG